MSGSNKDLVIKADAMMMDARRLCAVIFGARNMFAADHAAICSARDDMDLRLFQIVTGKLVQVTPIATMALAAGKFYDTVQGIHGKANMPDLPKGCQLPMANDKNERVGGNHFAKHSGGNQFGLIWHQQGADEGPPENEGYRDRRDGDAQGDP